jgi:hypothetical protein
LPWFRLLAQQRNVCKQRNVQKSRFVNDNQVLCVRFASCYRCGPDLQSDKTLKSQSREICVRWISTAVNENQNMMKEKMIYSSLKGQ